MGHAKLTDSDHSSNWPEYLKSALKKSAAIGLDDKNSEPVVINMVESGAKSRLEKLIKDQAITAVTDNYDEQLAELLTSRDAHLYRANFEVKKHSIKQMLVDHYGAKKPWEAGCWVYYPWTGELLHVLDEELFSELRTVRNRDLITAEEQQILSDFRVGCAGMSVGSSSAIALTLSGISNQIKIADGAVISGSNLNRILTGINSIGEEKAQVIGKKIYEMNPFISVHNTSSPLSANNIAKFFDEPWPLDLIIDEIDNLEIKIRIRIEAKKRKIPVLMATELGDSVMLDVERFDLEPNRELFHGLIKGAEALLDKKEMTQREWMKHATSIIGTKNVPLLMQQSLLKIGTKVVTHPQLGSTAIVTGGVLAFAVKQIALGTNLKSQREIISLEKTFLPEHNSRKHRREHARHTKIVRKTMDSL